MCPNPQEAADLVTFTEKTLNGKLHFLCSVIVGDSMLSGIEERRISKKDRKVKVNFPEALINAMYNYIKSMFKIKL